MASLNIVIGFDGAGQSAKPSPVYVGYSGSEARAAMEKSDAVRFEIFRGITGLRKSNSKVTTVAQPKGEDAPQGESENQSGAKPEAEKKKRGRKPKGDEAPKE